MEISRVSTKFVDETLWPEFEAFSSTLRTYLSEVTDRVVSQVIHPDSSEAIVVDKPSQFPSADMSGDDPPLISRLQQEGHRNSGAAASPTGSGAQPKRRRDKKKRRRKGRRS